MDQPITYVGLDVHKDTIAVALAEMGKPGEVRVHGTIANAPAALKGRVPGPGVRAVGKWPAAATAKSQAEAGPLSTAVVIADLR